MKLAYESIRALREKRDQKRFLSGLGGTDRS